MSLLGTMQSISTAFVDGVCISYAKKELGVESVIARLYSYIHKIELYQVYSFRNGFIDSVE